MRKLQDVVCNICKAASLLKQSPRWFWSVKRWRHSSWDSMKDKVPSYPALISTVRSAMLCPAPAYQRSPCAILCLSLPITQLFQMWPRSPLLTDCGSSYHVRPIKTAFWKVVRASITISSVTAVETTEKVPIHHVNVVSQLLELQFCWRRRMDVLIDSDHLQPLAAAQQFAIVGMIHCGDLHDRTSASNAAITQIWFVRSLYNLLRALCEINCCLMDTLVWQPSSSLSDGCICKGFYLSLRLFK